MMPSSPSSRAARLALHLSIAAAPLAGLAQNNDNTLKDVLVKDSADSHVADTRVRSVSTATRTSTPPKEVPQSIESVSVERALDYGQNNLGSALAGVAGVNNAADTRFDSLVIRGFTSSADLFLDGIRDDAQYVRDLGNTERIEVLKGPAAVLYGRGSGGGVVNRISKQPQAEAFGRATVRAGTDNLRGAALDLNRPLSPTWSARLNVAEERADSFRNEVHSRRSLVAPALRWDNQQGSSWLLQYDYTLNERTPDRGIPGVRTAPPTGSAASVLSTYQLPTGVSNATTYGDPKRDVIRDEAQSWRSTLSYAINADWALRHTLGYIALDNRFDNTYMTDAVRNPTTGQVTVARTRFTQQLQHDNLMNTVEATGRSTLAGMVHTTLFGLELGQQKRDTVLYTSAAPSLNLTDPNLAAGSATAALVPNASNRHRVATRALYAQDQIDLAPQWKLLAGLRHDHFKIDSTNQLTARQELRESSSLSPRVGLVWSATQAHSLYASYTKNFAPVGGGLIGITPGAAGNELDPEYTRQVETGLKSDWLGGRLSSTVALYQLELYNRRTTDPNDPTKVILTGLQRSRGLEASLAGRLAPAWYLRSSLALQSAEVLKAEARYVGKQPVNTSARNGSVFISYAPQQGLYAEAGVTYVGRRYADRDNLLQLPGYARADAMLGYRLGVTDLQLAISNLGNRNYWVSSTSTAQLMPGTPRSALLTLKHHF